MMVADTISLKEKEYLVKKIDNLFNRNFEIINKIVCALIAEYLIDEKIPVYQWTPDSLESQWDSSGTLVETKEYFDEFSEKSVLTFLESYNGNWRGSFESHRGKNWICFSDCLEQDMIEFVYTIYKHVALQEKEAGKIEHYFEKMKDSFSFVSDDDCVLNEIIDNFSLDCEYNEIKLMTDLMLFRENWTIRKVCENGKELVLTYRTKCQKWEKNRTIQEVEWENYLKSIEISSPFETLQKITKKEIGELEDKYSKFELAVLAHRGEIVFSRSVSTQYYGVLEKVKNNFMKKFPPNPYPYFVDELFNFFEECKVRC